MAAAQSVGRQYPFQPRQELTASIARRLVTTRAGSKRKRGPERQRRDAIEKLLAAFGAEVISLPSGVAHFGKRRVSFGRKGLPDLLALFPRAPHPYPIFIETKSQDGKLSPEQHSCHESFRQRGILVIVARSVDDVIDAIGRAGLAPI